MNLKNHAISGVKWTTASTSIQTLLQLAKLFILARFLLPSDFGLMAIMMIVIGFSQAFMDMGISNAIIHRQEISHTQLSTLYWISLLSGLVLSLIIAALSPLIALFYKEPRISELMLLLSWVFVIVAVGNQYRILCQKKLQFSRMAKIEMSAAFLSFIVAVTFAVKGYGVFALVFAMLVQSLVSSVLFLFVGLRYHYCPSLVFKYRELKGYYSFGLYQMGEKSINYFSANIDKLLIGKLIGMEAVGFYNMAWQLIIFPLANINPIVNRIAFPIYAKVQNDPEALNKYYSFNVKVLSMVTIPLLAFLCFFSSDVVLLVFGKGWMQTAVLVNILALVGIGKALGNPGGAILLALGRADVGFWWNVAWAILISATLYVTLTISPHVTTVAYALMALSLTTGIIWHYIIAKVAKIYYRPIIYHFLKIIFVSFVISGLSFYLLSLFQLELAYLRLLSAFIFCCLLYGIFIWLFEKNLILQIKKKGV